jgi:hypothetical protein
MCGTIKRLLGQVNKEDEAEIVYGYFLHLSWNLIL